MIQGALEWLPVSSRGNVIVFMTNVMGLKAEEILSTSIYLHIGTALAAIIYYQKEVKMIIRREGKEGKALFNFLFISTIMTGMIGLPIYILTESVTKVGETLLIIIGGALILTGIIQKQSGKEGEKDSPKGFKQALILGIVQGFSAIPGLSRSGLTTSYMLLKGTKTEVAFKLSFIMSIPASIAASIGLVILKGTTSFSSYTIISIICSFIVGLLTLKILVTFSKKSQFWKLCIVLGAIIILLNLPAIIL